MDLYEFLTRVSAKGGKDQLPYKINFVDDDLCVYVLDLEFQGDNCKVTYSESSNLLRKFPWLFSPGTWFITSSDFGKRVVPSGYMLHIRHFDEVGQ